MRVNPKKHSPCAEGENLNPSRLADISLLPNEVLLKIFKHLNIITRGTCCQVSKQWNQLNQQFLKDVSMVIAVFNKSIPNFIGYTCTKMSYIHNQVRELHPEITSLEISDRLERLWSHNITFQGEFDENGKVFLKRSEYPIQLKAVALEFDQRLSNKTLERVSNIKKVNFTLETTWKEVGGDYNGNYPDLYDEHTHSPCKITNFRIVDVQGCSAAYKTLNLVCQFLNQRKIQSIADSKERGLDAKIWTKLLRKEYIYI